MEDFWHAFRRISLSVSEPMLRHGQMVSTAGGRKLDDAVLRALYTAMRLQALIEAGEVAPSPGWNEQAEQTGSPEHP